MNSDFLYVLEEERKNHAKNGLLDYTMVSMSYNTNKMEGSSLTLSDTQALYERDIILTGGHLVDDITEGKNHFALFDFMLETINEPLSERLLMEYHQLLKKGTTDEKRYGSGVYKIVPNIAGEQATAQPYEVPELMERLVNEEDINDLSDILSFHHRFELIHPFQDGNGRVGRIIMFRQCLVNDITPFIIPAEMREEYIKGLKVYRDDPSVLEEQIKSYQESYGELAKPFIRAYVGKREKEGKNNDYER